MHLPLSWRRPLQPASSEWSWWAAPRTRAAWSPGTSHETARLLSKLIVEANLEIAERVDDYARHCYAVDALTVC